MQAIPLALVLAGKAKWVSDKLGRMEPGVDVFPPALL